MKSKLHYLFILLLVFSEGFANELPLKIYSDAEIKASGLKYLNLGKGVKFAPRHNGKTYFVNADTPLKGEQPTTYVIDSAIEKGKIIEIGIGEDISSKFLGESFETLPVTFRVKRDGEIEGEQSNYDVSVLAINFRTDAVYFTVGCKFVIPGQGGEKETIYFGAKDIKLNYKGGSFSGELKIIETGRFLKNSKLGENFIFELGPSTSMTFDCGKFKKFTLDGVLALNRKIAIPEDPTGKPIDGNFSFYFRADVEHWRHLILNLKLPGAYGFHLPDYPDVGFWFSDNIEKDRKILNSNDFETGSDGQPQIKKTATQTLIPNARSGTSNIVLDLSGIGNVPMGDNCVPEYWKGLYIEYLGLRLPEFFKNRNNPGSAQALVSFQDIVIGNSGLYGAVRVEKEKGILKLADGEIGEGWDVSVKMIEFERKAMCAGGTEQYKLSLGGEVRPPAFSEDEPLIYEMHASTAGEYLFKVSLPKDRVKFDVFSGLASISLRNIQLQVLNGDKGQKNVKGLLTVDGCIDIAQKAGGFNFGLGVQGLTFTTEKPFIKEVTGIQLGCNNSKGIGLGFGGFEINVSGNARLQVDNATDKISMDFKVGVALGDNEDGQGFRAEGKFLLLGHVAETNRRFFMVNDSLKLTGLKIDGNFGVVRFWGDLETFDDDRGKGFDGFMGLTVSMSGNSGGTGGISAGVRAAFGKKDDYKYWYLDAGVEMSVPLGFLSLKGVVGGGYKNVEVAPGGSSLSGFSFKPKKGAWGFRLGVMLGLKLEFPAQLNGMLEVVGGSGGSIKTVFLASDVNFNMDGKENQGLEGFKTMVKNSYMAYMQFNELLASEKKGEINANNEKYRAGISGAVFGFRPVSSSNSFRLGAGSMIWYDVDNGELNAIVYPDIDIKLSERAQLNSKGVGLMHFSSNKWYIHLGRSQWDERLGIVFALPGVRAEVNAYVMLGHGINTQLPTPRVPDAFANLFKPNSQSKYCSACSDVSEGKGLALGAAITVEIISKFPVGRFSAYVNAGAGFDFILVKVSCPEGWGDGTKSFRGEGQLYGYFDAGIKWKSKDICKLGAGFRLAAGGFQPTWADGKVKVFVKVIGIKFNMNVKFHIGNKPNGVNCAPPPVSTDVEMMPVSSTYPVDKATEVARNAKIKVFFKGEDSGVETEDGDQKVSDMEEIVDDAMTIYTVSSTIKYENVNIAGNWTYTSADSQGGRQAVFTPSLPLPANKLIEVSLKMGFKDEEGVITNEKDEAIYQTINFSFRTTSTNKVLLTAEKSLPYNGQYSVFKGHSSSYVEVDKTELALAKKLCPLCKYNLILKDTESGNEIKKENLQFNGNTDRVSFDKSSLDENKVYDLQLEVAYPEGDKEVMYKQHFFRVSNHNTFAEKIAYIDNGKEVVSGTTSNGIPVFKVVFDDPNFEGFSEKELKSIISNDLLIDNWKVQVTILGKSFFYPFNSLGKSFYSLLYKPYNNVQFTEGIVKRMSSTQAVNLWEIQPYTNYILKYITKKTGDIIGYEGGLQRIMITYKEEKESEQFGYLSYDADPVNFNNLRNKEHIVQVKCKRGGKDSDPIIFETTVFENQEKQSTPFPLTDELSLKIKLTIDESKADSIVANLAPPQSTFKLSGFKSILDCPTSSNVSLQGVEREKYRLVFVTEPRPHHPPFIRVSCAAKTVDYTPMLPEYVSSGNPQEGVKNPLNVDNPQFLESFEAVQIYAYEDEFSALPQKVTSAVTVTLKNGRTCILPVGKSFAECSYRTASNSNSVSACENAELSGGTGPNAAIANKKYTNKWSVSTLVATPVAACGFNDDAGNYLDTLYSESVATSLANEVLMSAVPGSTRQLPESGYYKVKETGTWIYIADGVIKEIGSCKELDPFIAQECSITSNINGDVYRQVKYNFFTNPDKLTPYILPTGLSLKLSDGQQVSISAGVSEYIHILDKNQACTSLSDDNEFSSDNKAFDCKQTPPKPILKISKKHVKVGEAITLSVENCAGDVQWIGVSGKGSQIITYPTEAKNYSIICEVNGCQSSESDKVGITIESFTISYSTTNSTNNQLVCYGSDVTLTANGCGGTIKWKATGAEWNAEGQSVIIENFVQNETYKAVCETSDGIGINSRNELPISFVPIPAAITITSDKGNASGIFICTNQSETITLSVNSACELGTSLMWYYNTGTSTDLILSDKPTEATEYYAVCQKSNALGICESASSNIIGIKTISLTTPKIAVTPKKEGTCQDCKVQYSSTANGVTTVNLCEFETASLSATACYADENSGQVGILEWRRVLSNNTDNLVTDVSNITENGSYKVICKVEHCESSWSNVVKLVFYPTPSKPTVTSSATSFVCTKNGSGTITLTANGCLSDQAIVWFKNGAEVARSPVNKPTLTLNAQEHSGSYTAQCMGGANCRSTNSDSVNVDLRTIPDDPIAEHGRACDGQDITIGAAGCSGDYLWSNQLPIASHQTISGLNIATHNYTVRCRVNSCESSNTTVRAVIHPYPVITGTSEMTICQGMEVQLNANCNLGDIIWPSGVSAEGKASPGSTTDYVVACVSNECRTEYTITVNVNPNPSAPSMGEEITVCDKETIEATCQQGMRVAWKGSGFVENNYANWEVNQSGKYEAICKNPNTGCESGYSSKQVNVYYTPSVSISQQGGTDICSGQEVILTASCSGNTFSWSHGLGTESVVRVKPGSTTTYTAYCSDSGRCEQKAEIEIKVRQTPSKPSMTGPSEACQSGALGISCGTNINVAWNTSETGSRSYEELSVTSTGSYTAYCYNNNNGCRSESNTHSMTVHSQPTLNVPVDQAICQGQEITLTASCNGSNFKWEGFTNGETSITVSPASSTIYTAKCSNNGYCEQVETVTVTVNTRPAQASIVETKSCGSTNVAISCNSGDKLAWNNNSYTSSMSLSFSTSNSINQTVYCYKPSTGCWSDVNSKTITINELPPTPTISVEEGSSSCSNVGYKLKVNNCDNHNVRWSDGNTSHSRTITSTGNYNLNVKCISSQDCESASTSSPVVFSIIHSEPKYDSFDRRRYETVEYPDKWVKSEKWYNSNACYTGNQPYILKNPIECLKEVSMFSKSIHRGWFNWDLFFGVLIMQQDGKYNPSCTNVIRFETPTGERGADISLLNNERYRDQGYSAMVRAKEKGVYRVYCNTACGTISSGQEIRHKD